MNANTAATGVGSGVVLAWLWSGTVEVWTGFAMTPEVAAAIGPVVMAILERNLKDD